ncbi:uncharacterized protein LOC8061376 isoform X2 [Sorghum bicolor]|uniref:uncharacterized protein LOC8061376 isoform X2 n=1 Tax=Sorghum bicolor TaxID=4558 RepID=UPI000B4266F3|nr:uncharacterized protein LOC8061376 isoform X2 [Sorghum bicolor]|eukprot:XP_021304632.1 uncharacterized protein LOC8061376 isoform X2 [Sorghum bicolor]
MGRGRPRKKRLRSRGADDDPALFPVGAEVEVRSDDPGFVASYYEATVEGYQHSDLSYVVAYSTLNRRDGGDSPLREVAAATNVRPRPPHRPPPRRGFAMHDMVDAFHNGGWWAGVVVCAVPPPEDDTAHRPCRVYRVCFPTSRELLDLEETALRPSRVFLDDCWLPAAAAKANGTLFREGSQVEVSRSTKTFGKYWSPATVLKVIGSSSFLVQYRDVKEDGELVTEILDSQYIRPTRDMVHMDSKYRFAPSSHAEVLREGSWWPGVILEVLDIESTKKYVVKIKSHEADNDDAQCTDLLTVDHTQLRPRYDWYHGKWVPCLLEKPVSKGLQSTSQKRRASVVLAMASCNDSVDIASLAPCIDNDSISYESGSHLMEKVNKDVVSEPFWPDLVSNENDPNKHKASTCPEKVVKQQGTLLSFKPHLPTKRKKSSYPEKVVKQQGTVLSFESHLTLPSRPSVTGFGNLNYGPKLYLSDQLERSSSQMVAKPSAPQTGQLQASLFGSFGTLRPLPHPHTPSFILPSHTIEIGSIVGSNIALAYQEKQSTDGCCDGMASVNQNTNFGLFTAFKKFSAHEEHGMSKQDHTSVTARDAAEGIQSIKNSEIVQLSSIGTSNSTEARPDDTLIAPEGAMVRYAAEGSKSIENSEIIQFSAGTSNSTEARPDDTLVALAPKGAMVRYAPEGSQSIENSEITQLSSIGTSNSTEARPGDTLIAPKGSEVTPTSKFVPSRTHCSGDSLLQRSRNVQESIMAEQPSGSSDIEEIPFVKTSPLWAHIEAMEVFRKVSQRPNFHKCQQQVPELREGMALGLMLCFANLAESVKRLCIEDDDAVFEEKMKGVSLLEADGFDVEHLRSRLETLLRIKKGRAKLQGTIKDMEQKFSHEETERRTQMGVLNMTVRQLELQACLFRCMMHSAISQELSDASEISRLKAEVSKLEHRFSSTTASPW